MEAAMNRGKTMLKAIPLLIGMGLLLSACAADPGYDASAFVDEYDYPAYGSLEYDYWGGWGGGDWHHRWNHGHDDHGNSFHH
jgi:hypothetical protein